jgi:hypothetical protein
MSVIEFLCEILDIRTEQLDHLLGARLLSDNHRVKFTREIRGLKVGVHLLFILFVNFI